MAARLIVDFQRLSLSVAVTGRDFNPVSILEYMSSPPPNSGCLSSMLPNEAGDDTFASSDECAPYLPGGNEVASAAFPGEFPIAPSTEPSTGNLERIQEESNAIVNSPIGSVNSHESFKDEVAELHDYLEKVLIMYTFGRIYCRSSFVFRMNW